MNLSYRKKKLQKKSLLKTHLRIIPSLDGLGRNISICTSAYHYGLIPLSTLNSKNHCGQACDYFKKFYFEKPFFEEETLSKLLKKEERKRRKKIISIRPIRDEEDKPFFWVLDRGKYIYFAKPKKINEIERISEDHFKLYINTLESIH